MKAAKYTIQQFNREYPDNSACLDHLFTARYGSHKCPKCGRVGQYHRQEDTSHYVCNCGGHQLSPKKDTIFEKSKTDLYKWFFAMFLMSTSKNGVSAKELERQLGVTYKCAHRMGQQIRSLMEQLPTMFDGTVEADETYVGGKRRGTRGRGAAGKTPVFGISKRKGGVFAKAVPNVKGSTVMPLIRDHVKIGSNLMTDEFGIYNKARKSGYKHQRVNHGIKEYVRGKVHTNNIEGFWGQLKRSLDGTHHSVSGKHLQAYVDQHVYLWNHRNDEKSLFPQLLGRVG